MFEPVLQDRGEQARDLLSAPGPATAAEALALAILNGDIIAPHAIPAHPTETPK